MVFAYAKVHALSNCRPKFDFLTKYWNSFRFLFLTLAFFFFLTIVLQFLIYEILISYVYLCIYIFFSLRNYSIIKLVDPHLIYSEGKSFKL